MKSWGSIIFLLLCSLSLFSQLKFERETRIKPIEAPKQAVTFVENCNLSAKIRWYEEVGIASRSFEAKTKINRRWLSIEFDTTGNIQDVEFQRRKKDLSTQTLSILHAVLNKNFQKHRITKIQKHWSNKHPIQKIIQNKTFETTGYDFYELIVIAKQEGVKSFFEVTITKDGNLLEINRIINRLSDNLEF